MKKITFCISVLFFIIAGSIMSGKPGRCLEGTEYQIKAAMMVNFIQFVDWPDDVYQPADTLTIGIIGKDKFNDTLDHIDGRVINGKRLKIRRYKSIRELSSCQVVFIPESESYRLYEILRSLNGSPVLTIGETDGFTRLGGIISFYLEENHVRFEISKTAASNANLKISAKLMEIARVID